MDYAAPPAWCSLTHRAGRSLLAASSAAGGWQPRIMHELHAFSANLVQHGAAGARPISATLRHRAASDASDAASSSRQRLAASRHCASSPPTTSKRGESWNCVSQPLFRLGRRRRVLDGALFTSSPLRALTRWLLVEARRAEATAGITRSHDSPTTISTSSIAKKFDGARDTNNTLSHDADAATCCSATSWLTRFKPSAASTFRRKNVVRLSRMQ